MESWLTSAQRSVWIRSNPQHSTRTWGLSGHSGDASEPATQVVEGSCVGGTRLRIISCSDTGYHKWPEDKANVALLLGEHFWLLTRKKSVKDNKKQSQWKEERWSYEPVTAPSPSAHSSLGYFHQQLILNLTLALKCTWIVFTWAPMRSGKSPLKATTRWDPAKAIPL